MAADLVAFLASPRAASITGTEYQVPSTTSEVGSLLPLMHVRDFTDQPRTAEVSEVWGDQASRQGVNVVAGILFGKTFMWTGKSRERSPTLSIERRYETAGSSEGTSRSKRRTQARPSIRGENVLRIRAHRRAAVCAGSTPIGTPVPPASPVESQTWGNVSSADSTPGGAGRGRFARDRRHDRLAPGRGRSDSRLRHR